jgi:ABC-type antimicrobial peptide transport system permease subunit
MAMLSTLFAALAIVLAAVGLYAVLAYVVAQRIKEIGIRIALGATAGDVRRLLLTYVGRVAAAGVVVGVLLAAGLGRLGAALLVGVQTGDPVVIGGAAAIVLAIVTMASLAPLHRATSIDPAAALRAE